MAFLMFSLALKGASTDVAWIGGVGALSPTRVPGYAMRTYSGRPSSSIRFSTSAAMATSLTCRPSVCDGFVALAVKGGLLDGFVLLRP